MTKMLAFIKNNKILVGVILIVALYLANLFLERGQVSTPSPQPTTPSQAVYEESIIPGKSTKGDLVKKLGEPLDSQGQKLMFKSNSSERNHEATVEQDKVVFIKEIVTLKDEKRIDDIQKELGEPEHFLYGPQSVGGFNLYIYAENGLAYIGHPETGLLFEIWYFPPTTFDEFRTKYAPGYSTELPAIQ